MESARGQRRLRADLAVAWVLPLPGRGGRRVYRKMITANAREKAHSTQGRRSGLAIHEIQIHEIQRLAVCVHAPLDPSLCQRFVLFYFVFKKISTKYFHALQVPSSFPLLSLLFLEELLRQQIPKRNMFKLIVFNHVMAK